MVGESLLLEQCGQYLSVSEDVIRQLGDLRGRCLVTVDDPQHGVEVRQSTKSLLRAADGSRIPNAGLFRSLQFIAQKRRIQLRRRITPAIITLPEPVCLEFLHFPQAAQFLFQNMLGRIGLQPGILLDDVLADLAFAFPTTRIVVLGEHVRQIERIEESLLTKGVRACRASMAGAFGTTDDADESLPQVICSTPREAANLDFATAGIVILLDASTCQHEAMQLTLSQMDAAFRLFGFFHLTHKVAPSAADAMMATFGPDILLLQSLGVVRREVNVAWVPVPPPAVDLEPSDPAFGKKCYWQHERRNRRIKQLADRLRASSPLDRRTFGEVASLFDEPGYVPPSITILVDRPLHAVELSRLLPDWPVIADDDSLAGMDSRFCETVVRTRRQLLSGTHQIVLASAAKQFRGEMTDVVIWAGGGTSNDAIPRSWFSTHDPTRKPLLIVDLLDEHNPTTQQLSLDRRRAYLQRDIFPVDISASQGRLAMFLSRQKGGRQ